MGAEETAPVCEGVLEKKTDHRRLPIGPTWKLKYCVLNSEALRLYRSASKVANGCRPLRTIPLCHIKSVRRLYEDDESRAKYFIVLTEQNETFTFRYRGNNGWVAQIQIQLIHYKNRQDILRYKQLNKNMTAAESAIQRLRIQPQNNNDDISTNEERKLTKCSSRGYKTVVLPNYTQNGMGIGITVIPLRDDRVVVNRVLDGGPAMQLGLLKPHDQIVSANGHLVTSVEMLSEIVRNSPNSVTLVIKPRLSKPSPDIDDPKRLLKQSEEYNPDYINTTMPTTDAKRIFEKGFTKEGFRRVKESPKHFKFS